MPRGTPDTGLLSDLSHTGLLPPMAQAFHPDILLDPIRSFSGPLPRLVRPSIRLLAYGRPDKTVWALPRSLATTCGITVVFSSCGYLDVSVPHVSLLHTMCSYAGTRLFTPGGFPHSDIHGSKAICASPWLFAAGRVLHRPLVPRHPPCALISLT